MGTMRAAVAVLEIHMLLQDFGVFYLAPLYDAQKCCNEHETEHDERWATAHE